MAYLNPWSPIYSKISDIKELGERIKPVHPLKFLSTIFSNKTLVDKIRGIFSNIFKRKEFLAGVNVSLNKENNLLEYLPDFSSEIDVDENTLRPYFEKRNWTEMVNCLIKEKSK